MAKRNETETDNDNDNVTTRGESSTVEHLKQSA